MTANMRNREGEGGAHAEKIRNAWSRLGCHLPSSQMEISTYKVGSEGKATDKYASTRYVMILASFSKTSAEKLGTRYDL